MESKFIPCKNLLFKTRSSSFSFLCSSRRKNLIEKIFTIVFFLHLTGSYYPLYAQRLSRDLEVSLLTNQIGYGPSSIKTCVIKEGDKKDFEVVEITSGQVAYRGALIPQQGDFGTYAVGDFSKLV